MEVQGVRRRTTAECRWADGRRGGHEKEEGGEMDVMWMILLVMLLLVMLLLVMMWIVLKIVCDGA
jgi:hypothetical protein